MTNESQSSPTITSDSLLSILRSCVISAQDRLECWRLKREEFYLYREARSARKCGRLFDRSEYDSICERVRLNERFELQVEQLERLIVALEGNPFAGERKRVSSVIRELSPMLLGFFGEREFRGGVPRNFLNERVCFPVSVDFEVESTEEVLYALCRDDGTILAAEVPAALGMVANSTIYREVKRQLLERDWVWKCRKSKGKVEKVVIPPKR